MVEFYFEGNIIWNCTCEHDETTQELYGAFYYDASGNVVESIEISKSKESLNGDYREYWSEKSLREFMNGHEKTKYTANIVRYSGGNGVAGVQFDCKEG